MTMMIAAQQRSLAFSFLIFIYLLCLFCLHTAHAFLISPSFRVWWTQASRELTPICCRHDCTLFAKKKSRQKEQKTSGFGGKAVEACPCGSGLGYMKCCGKLHKDPEAFADATPAQVVRARYSAYAKREVRGLERSKVQESCMIRCSHSSQPT